MKSRALPGLLTVVLLVAGCAIGNKIRYDATAELAYRGSGRVAVAAQDQRSYVKSGDKKPDFVGLIRGSYGNPFNVTTETGRALAEDMTESLARSLAAAGFEAVPVVLAPSDDAAKAKEALLRGSPRRGVLLVLNEWKTDTYMNTDVIYDVALSVYAGSGEELVKVTQSGTDNIGGSAWNPPAHAKQAAPEAWKRKLEQLLSDPRVSAALR
jgi:hypothetical protein